MTSYATLYLPRTLAATVDSLAASDPGFLRDAALRFLVILLRLQHGGFAFVNLHSLQLRATVHHDAAAHVLAPLADAGVIDWNEKYKPSDPTTGIRGFSMSYRIAPGHLIDADDLVAVAFDDPAESARRIAAYYSTREKQTPDVLAGDASGVLAALYDAACNVRVLATMPSELRRDPTFAIAFGGPRFLHRDKGGRCYTHVSPLSKAIRPFLTFDGSATATLDLHASYARSAILAFRDSRGHWKGETGRLRDLYMAGGFYDPYTITSRDYAKQSACSWLSHRVPVQQQKGLAVARLADRYFRDEFPEFWRFVEYTRTANHGRQWQRWVERERGLMEHAYRDLFAHGLRGRLIDEHDGCRFPEENVSRVVEAFGRAALALDESVARFKIGIGEQEFTCRVEGTKIVSDLDLVDGMSLAPIGSGSLPASGRGICWQPCPGNTPGVFETVSAIGGCSGEAPIVETDTREHAIPTFGNVATDAEPDRAAPHEALTPEMRDFLAFLFRKAWERCASN